MRTDRHMGVLHSVKSRSDLSGKLIIAWHDTCGHWQVHYNTTTETSTSIQGEWNLRYLDKFGNKKLKLDFVSNFNHLAHFSQINFDRYLTKYNIFHRFVLSCSRVFLSINHRLLYFRILTKYPSLSNMHNMQHHCHTKSTSASQQPVVVTPSQ